MPGGAANIMAPHGVPYENPNKNIMALVSHAIQS